MVAGVGRVRDDRVGADEPANACLQIPGVVVIQARVCVLHLAGEEPLGAGPAPVSIRASPYGYSRRSHSRAPVALEVAGLEAAATRGLFHRSLGSIVEIHRRSTAVYRNHPGMCDYVAKPLVLW